MRNINIANVNKRDAVVSYESLRAEQAIQYVLKDGSKKNTVKVLEHTLDQDINKLVDTYGPLDELAELLVKEDVEFDIELTGMILEKTSKLYISKDHEILHGVDLYQVIKNPDGTEKERHFFTPLLSNVNDELPVLCSGKKIPKKEALKKFVFSGKYQIKHVNGLTYDFLYEIAKDLHDSNTLMLAGAGKKGTEPLVFYNGGAPYRGFLEGRIKGDKYCLMLHLTNLELKEFTQ